MPVKLLSERSMFWIFKSSEKKPPPPQISSHSFENEINDMFVSIQNKKSARFADTF